MHLSIENLRSVQTLEALFRELALSEDVDINLPKQDATPKSRTSTNCRATICALPELGFFESLVRQFSYPALIVARPGKIVATNVDGSALFGVSDSTDINTIFSELPSGETASDWVKHQIERDGVNTTGTFVLAKVKSSGETVRLGVAPLEQTGLSSRFAVLFLVSACWSLRLERYAQSSFRLTASELRILEAFANGADLRSIATKRNRSLATVRTQFYQILEKCGAKTQVELLHLLFEISQFLETSVSFSTHQTYSPRQDLNLPRQGGRMLQVAVAGNRTGSAVVLLSFAGYRCFAAQFEQQFSEANLQILSLSPPGYGSTSKPAKDEDYDEVACADYVALLDLLGIEKAVILADGPTLFQAIDFAKRCPERVQQIVTTIPYLPGNLQNSEVKLAGFADYMMKVYSKSRQFRRFSTEALVRAFYRVDITTFLRFVYKQDPSAFKVLSKSEQVSEIDSAIRMALQQGIDVFLEYLDRSYVDWSEALRSSKARITVYRPESGGIGDTPSFMSLVDRFPSNINYVSLSARSGAHQFEYPLEFIYVLKRCFAETEANQPGTIQCLKPFGPA